MPMFVLSLDGGGVRGVLQAFLIERLQRRVPFLEHVDFFAGTSIGGINAAFLAKARSVNGLVSLFLKNADRIFGSRDWIDRWSGSADELVRCNYGSDGLRATLEGVFGKMTFSELAAKCMVVCFDLDNEAAPPAVRSWKPKYGHNWDLSAPDAAVSVVDWCLRTSAAPTYFCSHQGYVDGGVIDNNPSASALAKAVKEGGYMGQHGDLVKYVYSMLAAMTDDLQAQAKAAEILQVVEQQIHLLSIGTGLNPYFIPGESHDYGYKQWILGGDGVGKGALLNMLFDGMLGPPDFMCRQLLGESYHRLNPVLPEVINLDDVDRIDDLMRIAENMDIEPTVAWLERCLGKSIS